MYHIIIIVVKDGNVSKYLLFVLLTLERKMNKYLHFTFFGKLQLNNALTIYPNEPCLFWTELVILMYVQYLLNYLQKYHYGVYGESEARFVFPKIFSVCSIEYISFSYSLYKTLMNTTSLGDIQF